MAEAAPAARETPGGCGRVRAACRQTPTLRDSRSAQTLVPVTWPQREHPGIVSLLPMWLGTVFGAGSPDPRALAGVCRRASTLPLVRQFFLSAVCGGLVRGGGRHTVSYGSANMCLIGWSEPVEHSATEMGSLCLLVWKYGGGTWNE